MPLDTAPKRQAYTENRRSENLKTLLDAFEMFELSNGNGNNKWVICFDGGIAEVTSAGWKIQPTKNAWTELDGELVEVFTRTDLVAALGGS